MARIDRSITAGRVLRLLHGLFLSMALCANAAAEPELPSAEWLIADYLAAWRSFYPSAAFANGDDTAAAEFEDFADVRVDDWLTRETGWLQQAERLLERDNLPFDTRVDLQVLRAQLLEDIAGWREDAPRRRQPQWYAEQVSQALTHLLVRSALSEQERSDAVVARLRGVARLCDLGARQLEGGSGLRSDYALRTLARTREFYASSLATWTADWPASASGEAVSEAIAPALDAIGRLEARIRQLRPRLSDAASIGPGRYRDKLLRRTAGRYDPESLRVAAGEEVAVARRLMLAEARRWYGALPGAQVALGEEAMLAAALEAMEQDRNDDSATFLSRFRELTAAAERFVREQEIATVPAPTTLLIELSPAHFSGAAVGGVYPAGPFAPDADTLFYVPFVPDEAPPAAREGFYRSFNDHFNTMIISHEMFPGHYLQYKVAVRAAPALRSLFPDGAYTEGWGSFVERVMLDAGWAGDAALTRLAHLRKRLENATRAYVSVQVHYSGWTREQVLDFARDEGLLAPQFAENLWQRVVNSPMQITDYFVGFTQFEALYARYRARAESAPLGDWIDAVLRAGPIRLSLLDEHLARTGF
jgi:uncharacterized protein (DUF885 family)